MLSEENMSANPMIQFSTWYQAAIDQEVLFHDAMHLGTVSSDGIPAGRIVLLRDVNENGFVFYTNYQSRKGQELADNPHASLTFFWPEMKRQVRVEGRVAKTSEQQSDNYFQSRPRGSQLGAAASPQSEVIDSRSFLQEGYEELASKYEGDEVPRPVHWGGFCVNPQRIEFWQDVPDRLHDRILYERTEGGIWEISRLAP
jgi:pyridoxamine 5'-phosphate oxidase